MAGVAANVQRNDREFQAASEAHDRGVAACEFVVIFYDQGNLVIFPTVDAARRELPGRCSRTEKFAGSRARIQTRAMPILIFPIPFARKSCTSARSKRSSKLRGLALETFSFFETRAGRGGRGLYSGRLITRRAFLSREIFGTTRARARGTGYSCRARWNG